MAPALSGRARRAARWSGHVARCGLAALAACAPAPAAPPRVASPPAAPAKVIGAPPAPGGAPRFTPPAIAGLRLKEAPSTYGPDTLFEFINGAADGFLAFDFEELTVVTYVHPSTAEVSVEVYRHRTAERAFGAYAMERPAGTQAVPIGIEGYGGREALQFVLGDCYVKLTAAHGADSVLLRGVADGVAGALAGTREPPPVLRCFPAEGRLLRAELFAARDFLGRGFLHDAVAVPYELGGAKFRLFAVRGRDAADARDMITRFMRLAGQNGTTPAAAGSATLSDPLNGRVSLGWQGRWVWGAVDHPPPASAPLLERLGARLAREQP